jgi:hypothetical protein
MGAVMRIIALLLAASAAAFFTAPATAQNLHTYVASYGTGSSCTRSAPCLVFGTAYSVTAPGGEITCLDSGEFGGFTIGQSITIDCSANVATAYYAMKVNAPGAVVVLRGITVLANGVEPYGFDIRDGIVHLENCRAQNFTGAGMAGINFAPATSGSQLIVADSLVSRNGSASSGGGILIVPGPGVVATAVIDRTRVENNRVGIYANGSQGTVHAMVRDSLVVGSSDLGIRALGTRADVAVDNTTVTGNRTGLMATTNGRMLVSRSSITLNATGLVTETGGTIVSYKNNHLARNTIADGAFTSTLATK